MLLLVTSQSVKNEWPSVCKFAQKTFPCCEVSPYSNFSSCMVCYNFLFINCVALFNCKENSPLHVNDYSEMSVLHKTYLTI